MPKTKCYGRLHLAGATWTLRECGRGAAASERRPAGNSGDRQQPGAVNRQRISLVDENLTRAGALRTRHDSPGGKPSPLGEGRLRDDLNREETIVPRKKWTE